MLPLLLMRILITTTRLIIRHDLRLHQWAGVIHLTTLRNIPKDRRRNEDCAQERNRVVHVQRCDRIQCWEDENDRHEQRPGAGPEIDRPREFSKVPGTGFEAAKDHFAEDGDDVGPIEGDGGDVEDTRDGGVGP